MQDSRLNIFKHELGHSLDLPHSSRWHDGANDEYGDSSTPMGNCQRCAYAAPHLLQLGWAQPLVMLSSAELRPGVHVPLVLPALVDAPRSVAVIKVDWNLSEAQAQVPAGQYAPLGPSPHLFLSFRIAKGQDIGLPQDFNRAISVHSVASRGSNSYLEAALKGGQVWESPALGGLVVVAADNGGGGVSVCRFRASLKECNAKA